MELVIGLIIFIFGLVIGSFLNVVIYRLPKGISVVWQRSFCPKCKHKINWFDNVPLISYLFLRGHCRFCRSPISIRYPTVELTTGALFVLGSQGLLSNLGNLSWFTFLTTLILFSSFIVIFFIDLEYQIIPDVITLPLTILFLIFGLITNYQSLITDNLPSSVVSLLFFLLIFLATKGKGMGFGDVKLSFLLGLVLGFPDIILCLYIAFLTGAFVGIILILAKKAKFKQKIAFGPFLIFGFFISYLWGEKIIYYIQKILF